MEPGATEHRNHRPDTERLAVGSAAKVVKAGTRISLDSTLAVGALFYCFKSLLSEESQYEPS